MSSSTAQHTREIDQMEILKDLHKIIHGNGRPGLIERMTRIETLLDGVAQAITTHIHECPARTTIVARGRYSWMDVAGVLIALVALLVALSSGTA